MPTIKAFSDVVNDLKADLLSFGSKFSDLNQGSRIAALVKAVASTIANGWIGIAEMQQIFFVSTAAGADLAARVQDVGMVPNAGSQATGAVLGFTSLPYTIPAGTLLSTADGLVLLEVIQTKALTSPFTAIPVIATQVGAVGNLPAGIVLKTTDLSLPNVIFRVGSLGVDGLGNPTGPLTGGANAETDTQIRNRFPIYLKTLSRATLASVTQAIEAIPGISSFVIQNHIPVPGWITISLTDSTSTISTSLRAAVDQAMLDFGPAGMGYILQTIRKTDVSVTATAYTRDNSAAPATLQANIAASLNAFSNTLLLGQNVYVADIYKFGFIDGLENFVVAAPTEDIIATANQLLGITSINISVVYVQ